MQTITLILNPQDLEIIGKALIELPFKVVAPVIDKINTQIKEKESVDASNLREDTGLN